MSYSIVRFKGRPAVRSAVVEHAMGERRDATVREARKGPSLVQLMRPDVAGGEAYAAALLEERKAARVCGVVPEPAREVLFAGPPRYGSPDAWGLARELAYFRDCLAWLRERMGPHSRLVSFTVHRDEGAPHAHATFVPCVLGRVKPRGEPPREIRVVGARRWEEWAWGKGTARERGARLQDDFHAAVGARHGLERGESHRDTGRANEALTRVSREESAIRRAEDEAERAREEAEREGRRAAVAKAAADAEDAAAREAEERRAAADAAAAKAGEDRDRVEREAARLEVELEAGARGLLGRQSARGRELLAREAAATADRDRVEREAAAAVADAEVRARAAVADAEGRAAAAVAAADAEREAAEAERLRRLFLEGDTKSLRRQVEVLTAWGRDEAIKADRAGYLRGYLRGVRTGFRRGLRAARSRITLGLASVIATRRAAGRGGGPPDERTRRGEEAEDRTQASRYIGAVVAGGWLHGVAIRLPRVRAELRAMRKAAARKRRGEVGEVADLGERRRAREVRDGGRGR